MSFLPRCITRACGSPVRAAALLTVLVAFGGAAISRLPAFAQGQSTTAPDNSGQNKQHGLTADQQSDRKSDVAITRKIRQAVIADKSLSTYAHNVKIITRHGVVTLRGPVASEDEKQAIVNKAEAVTGGADKVRNQLTLRSRN